VVAAYDFPNGQLESGSLICRHVRRVEHRPEIADFECLVRAQSPWGLWRLSQRDKFIAGGRTKSHGERINTEGVHSHAIDLNLFYSGAYESVKAGGKRNVGGRAFADTEIFDKMCLGGISGDEAEGGGDRQGQGRSSDVCHRSLIWYLWFFYNEIIADPILSYFA
jgi:hypothetical protein